MRSFIGLLWTFGGAVAGFVVGALVAIVIAQLANTPNRDGEASYLMIAGGIVGAVIGIVAGIALYARSAPTGQVGAFAGSTAMGIAGLVALAVLGLWSYVYFH
jgi:hypothetical protein